MTARDGQVGADDGPAGLKLFLRWAMLYRFAAGRMSAVALSIADPLRIHDMPKAGAAKPKPAVLFSHIA